MLWGEQRREYRGDAGKAGGNFVDRLRPRQATAGHDLKAVQMTAVPAGRVCGPARGIADCAPQPEDK